MHGLFNIDKGEHVFEQERLENLPDPWTAKSTSWSQMLAMDPAATAAVEVGMEGKDTKVGEATANARQIGSHHTYPHAMDDEATRKDDCSEANPAEPSEDRAVDQEEEVDGHKARHEHGRDTAPDHPERGRHGTVPDWAAARPPPPRPPGPRTSAAWAASSCRPRPRRIRTSAGSDTAAGEVGGRGAGEGG